MAYDRETARRLLGDGINVDLDSLARSVGLAEGGSVDQQHKAALEFWGHAVALVEEGALPERVRAVAAAEITRHTAALQPTPEHNRYGPPPDFKGQPV